MPIRLLLVVSILAVLAPCFADSKVLDTSSALDVKLHADKPILPSQMGPVVRGTLTVTAYPIKPVCDRLAFYVDGDLKAAGGDTQPTLELDTTRLQDGEHELRLEAFEGSRMVMSSGSISFRVANTAGSAVLANFVHVPEKPSPTFTNLYRTQLSHEAIWFNGTEGDLERHAYLDDNRLYITLSDLLRHIGGKLIWGPTAKQIEVHRNDVTVQITPGTRYVKVNNNRQDLGQPVVVHHAKTYVPLRAMCDVFGVYVEYSDEEQRAYVYAPQPSFAVQLRDYPWIDSATGGPAGGGEWRGPGTLRQIRPLDVVPGLLSFKNLTTLPIHVLMQGNGFRGDWQINARDTLGSIYLAPGTYRITIWQTGGEDYDDYVTVTAAMHDHYEISLNSLSLIH